MLSREESYQVILMEECAELSKAVSKMIRFGKSDIEPGQTETTKERVISEYNDIVAMVRLLFPHDQIDFEEMQEAKWEKVEKFIKYSQSLERVAPDFGIDGSL